MKVKDLIEALSCLNPETEVCTQQVTSAMTYYYDVKTITEKTVKVNSNSNFLQGDYYTRYDDYHHLDEEKIVIVLH
jgi:hypothetical protein